MPAKKTSVAAKKSAKQAPAKKAPVANSAPVKSSGGSGKVAVGKKVPAFSSAVTGGGSWKSSAAAGSNLVIYFYPRDNTTGCTAEGEAFRDLAPAFKKANTVILGVSTDSIASHEKFKAKYRFPFELLSDESQALCQLFDVIKEKSMYGRKFMGVERSTFLIGADGVLRQEWRKVKVPGHAEAVLDAAKAL
ncbi:peroxiredoxin [Peristeroidobacter soli]|uniref:peroxiredoxin n=1 Tax=Peristeroidobacter soli TaxID=2497877 RepID=UPI00101D4C02|nr:peroxiredoxin [Peristeroidobacter soli]